MECEKLHKHKEIRKINEKREKYEGKHVRRSAFHSTCTCLICFASSLRLFLSALHWCNWFE